MTVTEEQRAAPAAEPVGPREHGPRLSSIFTAVFTLAGFALGIRQLHDNSFMWHLRTGRLILDHGIPYHDPYSFTAPGTKWVAQSWLAEVVYGIVNNAAGSFGLRMFGALVGAAIGFLVFRIPLRLAQDRVRAGLLAALTFGVLLNVWSERPLILGILAMLVVVAVVETPDMWIARRPIVILPIVFWLWANVHGTFVIGFGYLGLHLIGRAIEGHPMNKGRERQLLIVGGVSGLLTLVNPYGLDLVLFPLRLMARGSVLKDVSEWQSPNFREFGGMLFGVFLITTLVIFARKRPGVRDLLIVVAFAVLGLWAVRNVGLSAVVIVPILARLVRNDDPRPDERRSLNRMIMALLVCVLALGIVHARNEPNWELSRYPVQAFVAVKDQHLEGRHLFTTDAWGGYLIVEAWPDQKVFFDDRYDMYPISVNDDYGRIAGVTPKWLETLDKWKVDVVMYPKGSALLQALAERSDWKRVYSDKVAEVYARRSVVDAERQ